MKTARNLEDIKAMVYACTQCGYCRDKYSDEVFTELPVFRVCPVREHSGGFEHHYARGKIQIAQGILEGRFPYSPELIELLYTDPDCRLCTWVCHAEPVLDPTLVWRAMRQDIVAAGLGPPGPLKDIDSRVAQRRNVFGARTDRRSRWAERLELPPTGDVLYFAGCHACYPQPEIARATVAILKGAGIGVAYLGEEEWCCGVVQFHDGSISIAREMADHNLEAIKASGAEKVVTACAECYKSLNVEYPQIFGEMPFEVVHVSQVLAEFLSSGKLSLPKGLAERRMTYHDPCQLGRYCGVYEQPRQVLRGIPGVELVEMQRRREYAWCCGNGADLVKSMDAGLALEITYDRVEEAREAGAEAIVTCCPRCTAGLRQVAEGIGVYDFSVVVARAMGLKA
ncbi:(Fe-S)-binding protein [Chloroflexota bacterium]